MTTAELSLRALRGAASVTRRIPSPAPRALAEPPPGSGLRPILGDHGAPLVGHSFDVMGNGLQWARDRLAKYGTVSWFGGFGLRPIAVIGPEGIGEVLTNRDRAFSNEEGWGYFIGAFFERGVMLMDFDEHRFHRRIMQQAFKNERLVTYLEGMNPAIAHGIGGWDARDGFHVYPAIKQLTLDIATQVFVGTQLGPEADRINKAFVHTVHAGAATIRADVPGGLWHRGIKSRRLLEDYIRSLIPAKRAGDGDDLLSVLCHAETEDGHRFTDEDVVNHMIFVLMAAHDTSTQTLAWMTYLLGKHPEWQDRLREESRALGKPTVDYGDLDSLVSMDLVMRESLRLYAPVGMLMRRALKDTSIDGYFVPKGTYIVLGVFPTQRMSEYWTDPDSFDPERFNEERREDKSHQYAWTPFGGNVHKCIGMHFGGMEIKATLHQMLLRFAWSVPAGYEPPIGTATGPIPADGLPINLRRL
jgi:cytochrome P450